MAYTLPNFNLTFNLWLSPTAPDDSPPFATDIPCQVYVHAKADIDQIQGGSNDWVPPIYIRVPLNAKRPQVGDIIQIIYLGEDYYRVTWTQNIHMGFPNEYVMVLTKHCDAAGEFEDR